MTKRSKEIRPREKRGETTSTESPTVRRRRWPWVLLGLFALVYFLPAILLQTPLKQSAINWALSDFDGQVQVDSVSAGWFSAATLEGITATDSQGQPLLEIQRVTTNKSLVGFMTDSAEMGTVEIQSPTVHLQLRPDGSNLEDALANYLQPTDDPASPLPHVKLNLVDGQVHLSSSSDEQTWLINNLNVNSEMAGEHEALNAEMAATIESSNHPEGGIRLNVQLDPGAQQILAQDGVAEIQADGFPVAVLIPLLQRWVGPCNAIGEVDGDATLQFAGGGSSLAATLSRIELTQFGMVAPRYLQQDQVSLNRLVMDGRLELTGHGVQATKFEVESEVGQIKTNGEFDLSQLATLTAGEIPKTQFSAHGEIDLAKVASMLPQTLALHQDLQVQSGTVSFDAATRTDGGTHRLIVDLGAANLTAQRGQQLLSWHQPLRLTARVGQTDQQWVLEQVRCESDFLQIEGKADRQVGTFVASGNLAQLQKNLSQFVDLAGVELAGNLAGEFGWSFRESSDPGSTHFQERPVQIGGKFEITDPILQIPGYSRWSAPKLSLVCNAAGKSSAEGVVRINGGGAQAVVDREVFTARLATPIPDLSQASSVVLNWNAKGRLDGWLAHIRSLMWAGDFDATGQVQAQGAANVSLDKIQVTEFDYSVADLTFDGYGAQFTESEVTGDGKLSYNLKNGLIYIPVLNLASSSIAARGSKIKMTVTDVIDVTGNVGFRADVNRVSHWYGLSPDPDSVNWFGTAEGNVELSNDPQFILGKLDGVINDLVAAQRVSTPTVSTEAIPARTVGHQSGWSELLRENQVQVTSLIGMAQDFNSFRFSELDMLASAVQVTGQGTIEDLAESWQTSISGVWNPDWEKVNGLLDAYTYKMLQLSGQGSQPFQVSGPIFGTTDSAYAAAWLPPQLKMQTEFAWDSGLVAQLPMGPSKVEVDVDQSVVFLKTGTIPLVQGGVQVQPMIDLRQEDPVLVMEKGVVVDRINLSSEICRDYLKYVTPLVADATAAQGKLSVQLESVQVPIYQMEKSVARGTIQLHEGTIGAGPLAKQIFSSVAQVKQLLKPGSSLGNQSMVWMDLGDQDIPFAVQDGRVYHKGIRLKIDDVVVLTEGFVALDQSINMTAQIPIPDEWIGDNQWLAGLRGQSIQIPISGTVSQPRLNTQAIQGLSRQLLQQTAGNAFNNLVKEKTGELQSKLGGELNKAQDKLNQRIQSEFRDKVGGELQKGLEDLFKRDK